MRLEPRNRAGSVAYALFPRCFANPAKSTDPRDVNTFGVMGTATKLAERGVRWGRVRRSATVFLFSQTPFFSSSNVKIGALCGTDCVYGRLLRSSGLGRCFGQGVPRCVISRSWKISLRHPPGRLGGSYPPFPALLTVFALSLLSLFLRFSRESQLGFQVGDLSPQIGLLLNGGRPLVRRHGSR